MTERTFACKKRTAISAEDFSLNICHSIGNEFANYVSECCTERTFLNPVIKMDALVFLILRDINSSLCFRDGV